MNDAQIETVWREVLTVGHRHRLAVLPGSPKCFMCNVPLAGVGGKLLELAGVHPSRKNPQICNKCDDMMPMGGAEVDVGILFADIRGSTALAERLGPTQFATLLNRFYKASSEVLIGHRALIDKMVGDEVMALFFRSGGADYRHHIVQAAVDLLHALGYGSPAGAWLPVGVGVHAGIAYCGRIGTADVKDFTALGDTINTGARLQAEAAPGQVVISEELYSEAAVEFPEVEAKTLSLKGKEAPFPVRVLQVGEAPATLS